MGKTTIVSQTTKDPKLILATEDGETQGLQSIQDLDVPFIEIRDWDTFTTVHAELTRKPDVCQYNGVEYGNIILDSISCCGHLWWDKALKQLGWVEVGLGRGRAGLQPYSYVAEKGRQCVKDLMKIKANLIVIAREGIHEEGMGTAEYKSMPCIEMPGAKLYNELPGSFDAVVRLVSKNGQKVFVTQEESGAIAGFRVPLGYAVPKYCNPNIDALIRVVLGDKSALSELEVKKGEAKQVVSLPGR